MSTVAFNPLNSHPPRAETLTQNLKMKAIVIHEPGGPEVLKLEEASHSTP